MDIKTLYRPLEQLELAAAALYDEFSRIFGRDDPEAKELFGMLAREERSHYSLIQFEKRLVKHNPTLTWETGLKAEEVAEVVARTEALRRVAPKMSLREALAAALELENGAAEGACHSPKGPVPEELGRLIQKLRAGDHAHRSALEAFAKRRGLLVKAAG